MQKACAMRLSGRPATKAAIGDPGSNRQVAGLIDKLCQSGVDQIGHQGAGLDKPFAGIIGQGLTTSQRATELDPKYRLPHQAVSLADSAERQNNTKFTTQVEGELHIAPTGRRKTATSIAIVFAKIQKIALHAAAQSR